MSIAMFDTPYRVVILLFAFMLGGVMASFFTCMGSRMAEGRDWVRERSRCESCGHELGPLDLIPVFFYLFSGGRCRYCKAKIPVICLLSEIGLGLYYVLVVLKFGLSAETFRCMGLAGLLLGLSVVDMKIYEIPDEFIIAGIILWAVTVPFVSVPWQEELVRGLAGGFGIGGGMLVLSLIFDRILKKDSLGGGDIKLFFMTGLYLGLWCGLFNLIVSCLVGLVFVIILKKTKIPFGPSISIAVMFSLLYGMDVVRWYLDLFL
ncbi:MAG: prepilin peptidase [Solobacterium sp.]|nr:prepilin peptidase [Solobacterium sp.]